MDMKNSSKEWKKREKFIIKATKFITPLIEKGKGSYVWDADGNKFLDLNSGQFCLCFGHSYSKFNTFITNQMKKLTHTNTTTVSSVVLYALEELVKVTNNDFEAGILLSTGSEANEFALRYAKAITKKEGMVFLNKGYHGQTLGSQSVSSYGNWAFPKINNNFGIDIPESDFENLNELTEILRNNYKNIAAIIVEPVLGAGGMIFPPSKFYQKIKSLCDKYNILLIFDECQTGFGRTGKWFGYQNHGVKPDMLVFAKSSGVGLPVSGVLFNKRVNDQVSECGVTHFSSHQNDPLAGAAVLFALREIAQKNLLERNFMYGKLILNRLNKLSRKYNFLVNPRGLGLMIAFNIDHSKFNEENIGEKIITKLLSKGVILQSINSGRIYRMLPNYLISKKDIDFFFVALEHTLSEMVEWKSE